MSKKLGKFSPIFYRIRKNIKIEYLNMIYSSLVYPCLICCASVWADTIKTLINLICVLWKGIVHAIYGAPNRALIGRLIHEVGLLRLENMLRCITCTFVYRLLNNLTYNFFTYEIHQRTTRRR